MALDPVAVLATLDGSGIEIGAFQNPLPVGPRASVKYVDLCTPELARRYYPEAGEATPMISPDVLAPADRLPLPDGSQAFVLSSHLLEHIGDPIGALKEWHRVLEPDGTLFLRVPDQRGTFDRLRARTPLSHLIQDHVEAPHGAERLERDLDHYREWARCVNGLADPAQIEFWARLLQRTAYPIHFHCWQPPDVREVLRWLGAGERRVFEIVAEHSREDLFEFTFVARARKQAIRGGG